MTTDASIPLHSRRRTALYRFFGADDALLYVGITVNPKARDYQHASQSSWWPEAARKDICWYENWVEADAAEKAAITAERPRYNIAGTKNPPRPKASPRPARRSLSPDAKHRLRAAAEAARRAPIELRAAIVEAGRDGDTNMEIAQAINFAYSPDYIGKVIAKETGPRSPGRRPRSD